MFDTPQQEHHWLDQLIGSWTTESECQMRPDQPPQKSSGKLTGRTLGGLWTVLEGEGEDPEAGSWSTMMTLGYDSKRGRYVGNFVASMMSYLWQYEGTIDTTTGKLVLNASGPNFESDEIAKYQDILEIKDANHWTLLSQIMTDEGTCQPFMS